MPEICKWTCDRCGGKMSGPTDSLSAVVINPKESDVCDKCIFDLKLWWNFPFWSKNV